MPRTGRPTKIDMPVTQRTNNDGETFTVTIGERIIEALRCGTPDAAVAASVGIHPSTLRDWMTKGAQLNTRLLQPGTNRADLSQRERRLADFSAAADRAVGEWEVGCNRMLEQLGQGGMIVQTITEKIGPDDTLLERTVKNESLLPDGKLLVKRLQMRFPDRYVERRELTGPEGNPISHELRVATLLEAMEAQRRGTPELNS